MAMSGILKQGCEAWSALIRGETRQGIAKGGHSWGEAFNDSD
jgi:hypothetical protein